MWFMAQKSPVTSDSPAVNPPLPWIFCRKPLHITLQRICSKGESSGTQTCRSTLRLSLGARDQAKDVAFPLPGKGSVDRAPGSSKQSRDVQITLGPISRICAHCRASQTRCALFTHRARG